VDVGDDGVFHAWVISNARNRGVKVFGMSGI